MYPCHPTAFGCTNWTVKTSHHHVVFSNSLWMPCLRAPSRQVYPCHRHSLWSTIRLIRTILDFHQTHRSSSSSPASALPSTTTYSIIRCSSIFTVSNCPGNSQLLVHSLSSTDSIDSADWSCYRYVLGTYSRLSDPTFF
jgi:hypothetical protein